MHVAEAPTAAHMPGVAPKSGERVSAHSIVSVSETPLSIVDVQLSATLTEFGTPLAENVPCTYRQVAVAGSTAAHDPGVNPKSVVGVSTQALVSDVVSLPSAILLDVQLSGVTRVSGFGPLAKFIVGRLRSAQVIIDECHVVQSSTRYGSAVGT